MKSSLAKVLHHLGGRPLITYPLTALRAAGVDPIVVVVGHQADAVRQVCTPYGARFVLQKEQKGTGHAVRCALPALRGFDGDVLLIYGDLPFLEAASFRRLVTAHRKAKAAVSLLTERIADPASFGRIVRNPHGEVIGIVEDRDCSPEQRAINEINVGVYCANSEFLASALKRLRPNNQQRELYLTDIIELARRDGRHIGDAAAQSGEGAQISDRLDLAAREQTLHERINRRWMLAGVTLEDPASTFIGPDVEIGADTIIGPGTVIRGRTTIGANCRLDGQAFIVDSNIGAATHVRFGVVMNDARVGRDVVIGPFAQLRPATQLGDRVHIGNFVETKNARLGAGTKANHLAYLGDADIGPDTNIGAGTITCNYDGFTKARTVIGARVQVGSDSQLIAPINIGDDVYIATGTTVRQDVEPGALVFNPKPQEQRAGWTASKRRQMATASKRRAAKA